MSCDSSSPVEACNGGSIHTLGQTSVNRLAVKSLWHTDGIPPVGQVSAVICVERAATDTCSGLVGLVVANYGEDTWHHGKHPCGVQNMITDRQN